MKKLLICLILAFLFFIPNVGFAQKAPLRLPKWRFKLMEPTEPCPTGTVRCGNDCVDLTNDPNNCGNCGVVCPCGVCSYGFCEEPLGGCYDLARLLTGEGYSEKAYDFGSFSIVDEGGALRVTVSLNPDSIYVFDETHVKSLAFNYKEGSEFSTYTFNVNIVTTGVLNDENNVKLGGYKNKFDLRIPKWSKVNPRYTQDYQFALVISAVDADGNPVDLDPEDLLIPVEGNDVLIGLQLGGLETDIDGSDSAWVPFIDDDQCASPI